MAHGSGDAAEPSGERPAFYALSAGGWRDYLTLLHPPYTVWHLSYVVVGASLAPTVELRWLGETLLAFFLAMGIAAHALDELNGRPLGTRIPSWVLVGLAVLGLAAAVALGVDGMIEVTPWLGVCIVVGVLLVLGYNLELAGGRLHTDLGFGLAWGAFPVVTAYLAQTAEVSVAAVVAAAGCTVLSLAQRVLSTPVRRLRRQVDGVSGELVLRDGTTESIDARTLKAAPEGALRLLSLAVPLLALAMLVPKLG
jgi:hypothetical protein